jgi:hypothetical protein
VFDTYWPQFETTFAQILVDYPPITVVAPRDEKDILTEILESTRNLSQRMRALEIKSGISSSSGTWGTAPSWKNLRLTLPSIKALRDFYFAHALRQLSDGKSPEEVRDMLIRTPDVSDEMLEDIYETLKGLAITPITSQPQAD